MNTTARLLQAYTRLGLPNALDSDDVLSANLFGQYQIPVNMPADAKVSNAYARAGDTYAACGSPPCALDPSRPLRDQVSLKLPCEPAVDASDLPGDPLGGCLVTSARSRASTLMQRYEVWADQMTAGLHRERVPWMNDTIMGLRIATRRHRAGPSSVPSSISAHNCPPPCSSEKGDRSMWTEVVTLPRPTPEERH
ncbi:hypothetical protein ACGFIW_00165 [Micromonospora sp. NPDC048935]|uniref:hypothetical protein n=1 Tax=Micromonospora sp. NPDC048935 TaxID=3364262 RepID=UPI003712B29A